MGTDIKNLGLYTFSALLQADAAILGLLAVFVIYRLQSLETNRKNAFDIALNHGSSKISDAERLFLGVNLAEIHAILHGHRKTVFWRNLVTIAFTDNWKSESIKLAIPNAVTILVHIIVCAIGLYNANNCNSVFSLSPEIRIIVSLYLFVFLVILLLGTSYKSLKQLAVPTIPDYPKLNILLLSSENLKNFFSSEPGRRHLFKIRHKSENRFIMMWIPQNGLYVIQTILQASDDNFIVIKASQNMSEKELDDFVNDIKLNFDNYWKLPNKIS
jgi:hypothetical protein